MRLIFLLCHTLKIIVNALDEFLLWRMLTPFRHTLIRGTATWISNFCLSICLSVCMSVCIYVLMCLSICLCVYYIFFLTAFCIVYSLSVFFYIFDSTKPWFFYFVCSRFVHKCFFLFKPLWMSHSKYSNLNFRIPLKHYISVKNT